ncbi:MAG: hypothetical protein JWQ96_2002, partial [Segetibacter sp.]|nr:hypothetical protein [Segetibacter sp.]
MPAISEKIRISYTIIYLLLGVLVYSIFPILPKPDPIEHNTFIVHFSELVVLISIMGTGLKIDEPFKFKTWRVPFRLVSYTMLISIALFAFIAWYFLKLNWATSILLGAVLAPTDPVLASDVQVGPPLEDNKDNVRFSLSAEGGMNDGMAFPFTWLAITLGIISTNGDASITEWVWKDLFYRIIVGVAAGFILGRLLAFLVFYLPDKTNFVHIKDGFVGVATTLSVYGVTELLHGYGFIAVFVTALTIRNFEMDHKYHQKVHSFTDQIERILIAVLLMIFGGALVNGILNDLTWPMALAGLAFIFVVRPLAGMVSLIGTGIHRKEKLGISFFGIRGIGSFFYLSFALGHFNFPNQRGLWSLVSFIVLISI